MTSCDGEAHLEACTRSLAEVELLREACFQTGGGCVVLECIELCVIHGLVAPGWLATEFVRRFTLVKDAHVGTWDEAFGRPWPKGTRLVIVRRHKQMRQCIHAAVFDLVRQEPWRPFTRVGLFEEIGEAHHISASQAEAYYYAAVNVDGALNVQQWRTANSSARKESSASSRKTEDESRDTTA